MKTTLSIRTNEYDSFVIVCQDYGVKHEIVEHDDNIVRVEVEVHNAGELYYIGTTHQIQKAIVKHHYNNL